MPSLFVTLVVVLVVLPAFLLLLLVKLPKPMPYRWDVRYFLLMGMPADQFLSLILKVRQHRGEGMRPDQGSIDFAKRGARVMCRQLTLVVCSIPLVGMLDGQYSCLFILTERAYKRGVE